MKRKNTTPASDSALAKRTRLARVTSVTSKDARRIHDLSDWTRVDAMQDSVIDAAIAADPDAAAPFAAGFLARASILMPPVGAKKPIAFRVDPDVLEFFKRHGRGYQGRMNAVLRAFMQVHS